MNNVLHGHESVGDIFLGLALPYGMASASWALSYPAGAHGLLSPTHTFAQHRIATAFAPTHPARTCARRVQRGGTAC
jgi:hypothetical protein